MYIIYLRPSWLRILNDSLIVSQCPVWNPYFYSLHSSLPRLPMRHAEFLCATSSVESTEREVTTNSPGRTLSTIVWRNAKMKHSAQMYIVFLSSFGRFGLTASTPGQLWNLHRVLLFQEKSQCSDQKWRCWWGRLQTILGLAGVFRLSTSLMGLC